MERNEISIHEAKVFTALFVASRWLTNRQIAQQIGIAERTVRAHTLKLVKLNIVDQAEVFPGHRFRFSQTAEQRNRGYMERMKHAIEVFGDELKTAACAAAQ